jgi:DNA-binding SARP family transcriptional activator
VLEEVNEQLWRVAPEAVLRWDALVAAPPTPLRDVVVGGALKVLGRNHESAERLERALATGTLGPNEQLVALGDLCWVLAGTDPERARQTVARGEQLLDRADPERAGRFLTNTFIVDILAARFEDAIGKLERALTYFPASSQYRVGARINLALARWDQQGEFQARLETQVATLPDVWRLYPSDAPGQCRDVAMLHGWLGDTEGARAYFEQALAGSRHNPLVGLEVTAALASLAGDPRPYSELLHKAEAWGDAYTQEIITMHGVNTLRDLPQTARRLYGSSPTRGGLAAAAFALVLADAHEKAAALALLDENLAAYPDRPRQLYLRAARYRVTRSAEDLAEFLALTTAGARLLPGFVPLDELPPDRPELTLAYPLEVVVLSDWQEAAALRADELPQLELRLMGRFSAALFGRELRLTDRLQQLVTLFSLGYGRERTAEAMWPEVSAQKQRNNLGVQLSALRKVLEPWGFRTYVLEDGLQRVNSDHARLRAALAARDAAAALELYEEPFAPGLNLEVLEDERLELRSAVAALLHEAAASAPAEHSAELLERVLQLDPLHESALQGLLRSLLARGRRQEAVRRYRGFARRLKDEMDLSPLAETAALIEQPR